MTTQHFNSHVGPRARALNAIRSVHCAPPAYKPAQNVKGEIACTKCKAPLKFTVPASNGSTTGRCSTAGCLDWRE